MRCSPLPVAAGSILYAPPANLEVLGFDFEIDESQQSRGENDPGKLVPIEEGKTPQYRRRASIDLRKAQSEIRQNQKQSPSASFLFGISRIHRLSRGGVTPSQRMMLSR